MKCSLFSTTLRIDYLSHNQKQNQIRFLFFDDELALLFGGQAPNITMITMIRADSIIHFP